MFGDHNTWVDGKVYSSPAYIGVKSRGSGVRKLGVNTPVITDATQNLAHMLLGGNFFPRGNFETSFYMQNGKYTPYTLY